MRQVTDELAAQEAEAKSERAYEGLAEEALSTVRQTLMVSYRFLDRALWKMPFEAHGHLELIGTDGRTLRYEPQAVLRRYAKSTDEAVRDYLHLVCHCIFYHPFIGNDVNPLFWDLACDIVAEAACLDIVQRRFPSPQDGRRRKVIDAFKKVLGNLSAEKIYRHILANGITPKEADYFKALFIRDDHGLWYHDKAPELQEDEQDNVAQTQQENDRAGGEHEQDRTEGESGDGGDGGDEPQDADDERPQGSTEPDQQPSLLDDLDFESANEDPEQPEDPDEQAEAPQGEGERPNDSEPEDGPDDSAKQEWESISKQVKMDLETHAQVYGNEAGGLVQSLRVANRRKADYRSFLQRFAQIDEELAVNDDEFDLVYYSYGLRTFGNMPLIEPLEYRESKKVREFVIAIDTSGSVEGALVKRFVEETYTLLKSTESFFTKINIRIMQCDAHVQSDVKITSVEEFDRYMEHFELKGFGGTDFRPVFARVAERLEEGDFENLKGLIYFTDGYGTYPSAPPDYETVFVFADDGYSGADVPPWAMRLYLDTTQLEGRNL